MGEVQQIFRGVPKTFLAIIDLIMDGKIYPSNRVNEAGNSNFLFTVRTIISSRGPDAIRSSMLLLSYRAFMIMIILSYLLNPFLIFQEDYRHN